MTALFTPRRADGIAEWRIVCDIAVALDFGDVLTFEELGLALDRPHDPPNRKPIYKAVAQANKAMRRSHLRSLEVVAGVGYRVLHPTEHELQAKRYRKQSARRMKTGLDVVKATDLEVLDPDQRQHVVSLGMVMQGVCQAISSIDAKQRKLEALTSQQYQENKAAIAKHDEALRAAGLIKDES